MLSTRSPTFKPRAVKNSEPAPNPAHAPTAADARNPAALPRVSDVTVIRLSGPDAESFAQSQFMSDVMALDVGRWHWSGWLSAKGRVQALFALARVAPGELLLLQSAPPAAADAFCAALRRFVLRRRVVAGVDASLSLHADFGSSPLAADAARRDALVTGDGGAIGLDFGGDGGPRTGWLVARAEGVPSTPRPEDAMAAARWRRDDLCHGWPRLDDGTELPFTPHMLSLDRLKAFSVKKGCYPGQEIVARTHFLGQAKRQAWWLEGEGLARGLPVQGTDGRALGEIIAADAEGRGALAVLALDAPGTLRAGTGDAVATPPLGGLARPIG